MPENRWLYWKEEEKNRKWKLIPDTPAGREKAITQGAMFRTWNSFSEPYQGDGRPEPIRFGGFPLDFDDADDPGKALQDLKDLCLVHLPEIYEVDPYAIKFYLSGGKGFHAIIPAELFGAQAGDPRLPLIYKKIASLWKTDFNLKTFDLSLYNMGKGKMFRIPNVKRSNGRYKVPLTLEEAQDLPIEKLTAFGAAPREIESVDCDLSPRSELAELYKIYKKEVHQDLKKKKDRPKVPLGKLPKDPPPCIKFILYDLEKIEKPDNVNFNILTVNLINYFKLAGYDEDETLGWCHSFIHDYPHSTSYPETEDRLKHFDIQIKYLSDKSDYQFDCAYILGLGFPGSAFECKGCKLHAQGKDGEYRPEAKRINNITAKKGNPTSNVVPIKQAVMETNDPEPVSLSKEVKEELVNYNRAGITLRKLLEYDFPEIPDVISDGILPEGCGLMLVGEAEIGKSMITLEWAISLIMGWEILGFKVPKGRTVYIFQTENTIKQVRDRIELIATGLEMSDPPDRLTNHLTISHPRSSYNLKDKANVGDMILELRKFEADVFFIDPLISFHNADENNNAHMRQVLDRITQISRETGTAAIVVHHFGKPVEGRDTEYRYRGATSIKDWCDSMISITKKAHENKILRNIYFNKLRNGPPQKPLLLERDENLIHRIVDEESLCPPETVREILESLGGHAESQKEFTTAIMKEIGCSARSSVTFIHSAVERGTIKEAAQGSGRRKEYHV